MNAVTRRLLEMLQSDSPDRRRAAAIVIGELGIRETRLLKVLSGMAQSPDRAVQEVAPRERDFSSLTLSLSEPGLEAIKAKIRKFRKEILEMARQDTEVDRVYQVNFHVFPLSHPHPGRKA